MFKFKFIFVTSWIEPLKDSVVFKLTHLLSLFTSQGSGLQANGISSEELSQTEGAFWKMISGSQNPWVSWEM